MSSNDFGVLEETLLQQIVDSSSLFVEVYSFPQMELLYLSKNYIELSGKTPEYFKSLAWEDVVELIHPQHQETMSLACAEAVNLPPSQHVKVEIKIKFYPDQLEWTWVSMKVSALNKNEFGETTMVLFVIEDISSKKNLEDELQQAYDRLSQVMSSTGTVSFKIDLLEGKVYHDEHIKKTMLPEELETEMDLNEGVKILFHPDEHDKKKEMIHDLVSGRKDVIQDVFKINRRDGRDGYLRVSAKSFGGKVYGMSQDITEMMTKSQAEKMVLDKMFRTDFLYLDLVSYPDLKTLYMSSAFLKLIERDLEDMKNMPFEAKIATIHPDYREEFIAFMNGLSSLEEGEYKQLDYQGHFGSISNEKWVSIKAAVFERDAQGEVCKVILQFEDVTDIHHQREALEEAISDLDTFNHTVAHDLRSPLRHISSYIQLIEEMLGEVSPDVAMYMDRVKQRAEHAGELVTDLMKLAKASVGDLITEKVELQIVLEQVVGFLEIPSHVKFEWSLSECFIDADREALRTIMVNLIGNAVKYSCGQDHPRINVSSFRRGNYVAVCIQDNGIGFDERYKSKLFDVFQRLNNAQSIEGTGVGLSIVKKLVDKHRGKIEVAGEINKGAIFTILLPEP